MRKNKKANFRRLLVLNTPKDDELSKLVSKFETMIQSAPTIVFDRENNWCMIGIPKNRDNHVIIKRMINVMYSSNVLYTGSCNIPWLNLIYMSLDTKKYKVNSVCLLNKCHIISSAPPKYMQSVMDEIDPSLYYLRIKYDKTIDLLWDTELTDTIINNFKR